MKFEFSFRSEVAILPAKILRERLNECTPSELKLLCALACDTSLLCEFDERADSLAESLGMKRSELDEAMAYWRGAGAIAAAGTSAVTAKRAPKPSSSLQYTGEELANIIENNDLADMIDECQRLLEKTFTPTDINTVVNLYHNLGVEKKYITDVCAYCVGLGKKSISYFYKTACALYDQGVVTLGELDEHLSYRKKCAEYSFRNRKPSSYRKGNKII